MKYKKLFILYMLGWLFITPLSAAETYLLECRYQDVNYYLCGTGETNEHPTPFSTFYPPVHNPIYTAFFHVYPDVNIAHRGIDLIGETTIFPAGNGTVVEVCNLACGSYGKYIIINHHDLQLFTLYAHLSTVFVRVGDEVMRQDWQEGTSLGIMGNTGASLGVHLHFEVRSAQSHDYAYRLDPIAYLRVHINECSNMFGLVDALYSTVHQYSQWYGVDGDGYIYLK